jgi:hypothetical protein
MRSFLLRRTHDVSGVSGTGDVAEGIEFSDGTVALRWLSASPTSVVFHDRGVASVRMVHGHGGATQVVWTGNEAARREADLRDEADYLRQLLEQARTELATKTLEYDMLTLRAEDGGISEAEIDRLADAAISAIDQRPVPVLLRVTQPEGQQKR